MSKPGLKLVTLPTGNCADVPQQLRDLADAIEKGRYGDAHNVAWVVDCGHYEVEVGMCGQSPSPGAEAYYLLAQGMRKLESLV